MVQLLFCRPISCVDNDTKTVACGASYHINVYCLHPGMWSSPHVTGDVPPPDWMFVFTKASNHQVVLHGGLKNKGTYVLDLSRMVSL